MARWIKADGTEDVLTPRRRSGAFTLEELQTAVGGYIQLMPGLPHLTMIVNEDGNLVGLPVNQAATVLVHQHIAANLNVPVEMLPTLVGTALRYLPRIVGDVVVLDKGERL
jgi:hypothetical protein